MNISYLTVKDPYRQINGVSQSRQSRSMEGGFSSAVEKVDQAGAGEFLGITMIPEEGKSVVYGMSAWLSEKSTPNKPIVEIHSNLNGENEVYEVDISSVDPENASRMELFALCSYADQCGDGIGNTYGTWQTLRVYEENAKSSGFVDQSSEYGSAWEQFMNEKMNWSALCRRTAEQIKSVKDPNAYALYVKGMKLLHLFEKYGGN